MADYDFTSLVRVTTTTTGTGTITCGSASGPSYIRISDSDAVNGATYQYKITQGDDFSICEGVLNKGSETLTRGTVEISRIGGVYSTTTLTLDGTAVITMGAAGSHAMRNMLQKGMLDTDGTLAANSDTKIPTQKAVKTLFGTAYSAGGTDVAVTDGGTGASTAAGARTNLGLDSVVGDQTHAATGKTTPVDADEVGLIDSAASNVLKKLTWVNLKATLKTYFDTLYSGITRTVNAQTGTTYTFVLADAGAVVTASNASAQTYTIPPNSSVAFPVNTQIDLLALGAGKVSFAPGAGVTLYPATNRSLAQYTGGMLYKVATDTWLLTGAVVA